MSESKPDDQIGFEDLDFARAWAKKHNKFPKLQTGGTGRYYWFTKTQFVMTKDNRQTSTLPKSICIMMPERGDFYFRHHV